DRNLRKLRRGVVQRVWFRWVAVVAGVHREVEVVRVDHPAAGTGAEHPGGGHIGERLDHLDTDGGEVGGDLDLLLFAQGQRRGDQVELHTTPLRVGADVFARP